MRTETQAIPLTLAALLLARLAFSDDHLLYVRPAMRPWLVAASLVLAGITVAFLAARWTRRAAVRDHGSGALGWLLALPMAAVIVVPMEPLGSYAAARRPAPPPAPGSSAPVFSPLPPPVGGAVDLTLDGFVTLALHDADRQLEDRVVRLTGFVTSPDGDGVHLTRFALSCCAADAWATSVALRGIPDPPPPDDTWVTIEGTWRPDPSGQEPAVPAVEVAALHRIPTPADPYER